MCKVYNTIGSLTHIKNHLRQHNVEGFNSVQDLLSFQREYSGAREQLVTNQKTLLTAERDNLSSGIAALEQEIAQDKEALQQKYKQEAETLQQQIDALSEADKTFVQEFTYSFKALFKLLRITYIKLLSSYFISRAAKPKAPLLEAKLQRHYYLAMHFEEAVTAAGGVALAELDRKKRVIDELTPYIYGALGEHKVVEELKSLPDDCMLINDFTYAFHTPLYHKEQRTHIKTIQLDHVLVSPAGVFLIETKNWSKESVKSLNLRSPVDQIKRSSFALFVLINRQANFKLVPHHWGERKIPIRNLIVMINHKPAGEFQYVKVMTLNEVISYIRYFQPIMSQEETQEVAEYLVGIQS